MADDEYNIEELYQALVNANYSEEEIKAALAQSGFTEDEIQSVMDDGEDEEDGDVNVKDWETKEKVNKTISKEEKNSLIRAFTELKQVCSDLEKKSEGKRAGEEYYEQISEPLADTDTIRSIFSQIESYFNRPNLMNEADKNQIDLLLWRALEDILDRLEALPDEVVNAEELETLSTITRGLFVSIRNALIDGKSKKLYKETMTNSYQEKTNNYEDKSPKELMSEAARKMV